MQGQGQDVPVYHYFLYEHLSYFVNCFNTLGHNVMVCVQKIINHFVFIK